MLDNSLNSNILKVLTQLCINLQNKFDISPNLINQLINDQDFITSVQDINSEFKEKIENVFTEIEKQHRVNIKNISSQTGWEKEKCAHIIKEYSNGYRKFCNQHKYVHGSKENPHLGHSFIFKTIDQVREEKVLEAKMEHYQEYLNKLLSLVDTLILHKINQSYSKIRVQIKYVINLVDWLKNKDDCFKTKFITNQVIIENNLYNYNGYVDIYIPTNKLKDYLKEINDLDTNYTLV